MVTKYAFLFELFPSVTIINPDKTAPNCFKWSTVDFIRNSTSLFKVINNYAQSGNNENN